MSISPPRMEAQQLLIPHRAHRGHLRKWWWNVETPMRRHLREFLHSQRFA